MGVPPTTNDVRGASDRGCEHLEAEPRRRGDPPPVTDGTGLNRYGLF
jgi:hypothetical protein